MKYQAVCRFELKDASFEDYSAAYEELAKVGFARVLFTDQGGKFTLPIGTAVGEFDGPQAATLLDTLSARAKQGFLARGFESEIFIFIGSDWAWGRRTTATPVAKGAT